MILIVGATGMLGGEISRQLANREVPVRGMVRKTSDPTRVQLLTGMGIETVQGDLRDTSTFAPVLNGVSKVIMTASSMPFSYEVNRNDIESVDRIGMMNFIDYAVRANVQKFIYLSFSGHLDEKCPLQNAKRDVEKYLKKSGLNYTILRPSFFMEVWLSPIVGFDVIHHHVEMFGDGDSPISYISYRDVAKFAIESLTNSASDNAILELGGPNPVSQWEAVHIFEEISGSHFDIERIPVELLDKERREALDPMQQSFPTLKMDAARGDKINMNKIMHKFPLQLTSVRQYAESVIHRH